jgi:hypothetical protein
MCVGHCGKCTQMEICMATREGRMHGFDGQQAQEPGLGTEYLNTNNQ